MFKKVKWKVFESGEGVAMNYKFNKIATLSPIMGDVLA